MAHLERCRLTRATHLRLLAARTEFDAVSRRLVRKAEALELKGCGCNLIRHGEAAAARREAKHNISKEVTL